MPKALLDCPFCNPGHVHPKATQCKAKPVPLYCPECRKINGLQQICEKCANEVLGGCHYEDKKRHSREFHHNKPNKIHEPKEERFDSRDCCSHCCCKKKCQYNPPTVAKPQATAVSTQTPVSVAAQAVLTQLPCSEAPPQLPNAVFPPPPIPSCNHTQSVSSFSSCAKNSGLPTPLPKLVKWLLFIVVAFLFFTCVWSFLTAKRKSHGGCPHR